MINQRFETLVSFYYVSDTDLTVFVTRSIYLGQHSKLSEVLEENFLFKTASYDNESLGKVSLYMKNFFLQFIRQKKRELKIIYYSNDFDRKRKDAALITTVTISSSKKVSNAQFFSVADFTSLSFGRTDVSLFIFEKSHNDLRKDKLHRRYENP